VIEPSPSTIPAVYAFTVSSIDQLPFANTSRVSGPWHVTDLARAGLGIRDAAVHIEVDIDIALTVTRMAGRNSNVTAPRPHIIAVDQARQIEGVELDVVGFIQPRSDAKSLDFFFSSHFFPLSPGLS
jgi:hypothetical protein